MKNPKEISMPYFVRAFYDYEGIRIEEKGIGKNLLPQRVIKKCLDRAIETAKIFPETVVISYYDVNTNETITIAKDIKLIQFEV